MDENKIIDEVKRGEIDAYRQLVERYQTGLIIYCENMVKNRADAEDAAQEAFIKAYKNINDYDAHKGRFSTWLYRIAANCAIDHLRKSSKQLTREYIADEADALDESELFDDEAEQLRRAIDALEPPKFAEIIKAYYWEGKSYQEIADENDTTTNTVGTWMRRAKLQLKEVL